MLLADIDIEPDPALWPAVAVFLWVILAADLLLVRPVWPVLSRRSRWIATVAVSLVGSGVILSAGGREGSSDLWYPIWTLALADLIAVRETWWFFSARGRRGQAVLSVVGIGVVGVLGLLTVVRSESPASSGSLGWWLAGLVGLACLWSWRAYHDPAATSDGSKRFPLTARIVALALLLLLLLNPVAREKRVRYDRSRLVLLLDDSRSMSVRDVVREEGDRPRTRAEALHDALDAHTFELRRLRSDVDVLQYGFAENVVPVPELRVEARGKYTAIGDAVQQAYESALQNDTPVAGVLLFSDGVSNFSELADPLDAASSLAAGTVSLWAVGVGSEQPSGETRTIIARELTAPRRVSALNEMPIEAEFSFVGLQGQPASVQLLFDDVVVDRRTVRCRRPNESRRIRFAFAPRVGGLHKIEVRAEPARFRMSGKPASLSQYVHVTDDVIRVLYAEGKPRYEGTFLVRALAHSKDIRLQKVLLGGQLGADVMGIGSGEAVQVEWYHAVILGDATPGSLDEATLRRIRDRVDGDGLGLAVLGTRGFLGQGGAVGTPLADLLPVGARTGWMDQPVRVLPTRQGLEHMICRIADSDADVAEAWRALPPMRGACRFGDPKPAASVLAADGAGQPLLVAHSYGAGRVLALAFDSTWQWCMQLDEGSELHRRFWRQVVLWLANRRPAVWIAAHRPRYMLHALESGKRRVEIRAGVDVPFGGEVYRDVALDARMTTPNAEVVSLEFAERDGIYEVSVDPRDEGTYKLELVARSAGKEIGRGRERFMVESQDVEMIEKLADFDTLRAMAERTLPAGGEFATLDGLSALLRKIGAQDFRRRHEETLTSELVHGSRWGFWALFCGFVFLEWIVRKRRGMV